jgi:hypothetical protein
MSGVTISVQNLADKLVSKQEAEDIVAALDAQAKNDYGGSPWVTDSLTTEIQEVVLIEKGAPPPEDTWHLEILLNSNQPGALGYHEEQVLKGGAATDGLLRKASNHSSRGLRRDNPSLPLMKIFAETTKEDNASLAEVCSHEMLEAAVDPTPMKAPRRDASTLSRSVTRCRSADTTSTDRRWPTSRCPPGSAYHRASIPTR